MQVWEGELEDGLPSGEGTMTYPGEDSEAPADVFVGTLAAGLREGKGKYTFASGASFDGEYAANKRQGMGTMLYADGGKYAGEWVEDKFHGAGTYTYPLGDIYSGSWEDGKKHGAGSYISMDSKSTFDGLWINGDFKEGKWILKDGTTFEGQFTNGQPDGKGKYTFARVGITQEGSFSEGRWVAA